VEGIGHDKIVADRLHVERHKVTRQTRITEWLIVTAQDMVVVEVVFAAPVVLRLNRRERVVVNVDTPLQKICNIEVTITVDQGRSQSGIT